MGDGLWFLDSSESFTMSYLTFTFSHINTIARGCHARFQPVQQGKFGVQCLAGHAQRIIIFQAVTRSPQVTKLFSFLLENTHESQYWHVTEYRLHYSNITLTPARTYSNEEIKHSHNSPQLKIHTKMLFSSIQKMDGLALQTQLICWEKVRWRK